MLLWPFSGYSVDLSWKDSFIERCLSNDHCSTTARLHHALVFLWPVEYFVARHFLCKLLNYLRVGDRWKLDDMYKWSRESQTISLCHVTRRLMKRSLRKYFATGTECWDACEITADSISAQIHFIDAINHCTRRVRGKTNVRQKIYFLSIEYITCFQRTWQSERKKTSKHDCHIMFNVLVCYNFVGLLLRYEISWKQYLTW